MKTLDEIFSKRKSLDDIFNQEPQFSDEAKAQVKANNEAYALRQEENRPWFDKNPAGRLGVAIAQGISNSALNPAGYVARGMEIDTKPFKPENAIEKGAELAGEYGFDAAALGGLGKIAQGAGYLGKGQGVASKVAQEVLAPENTTALLSKFVAPAVGGGLVEGITDPRNPFERSLANVAGAGIAGGLVGGFGRTATSTKGGLKETLPNDKANAALSKGVRADKDVARQISKDAPAVYNELNAEMTDALDKAVGRKLNIKGALDSQQQRYNDYIGQNANKEVISQLNGKLPPKVGKGQDIPTEAQLKDYQPKSNFNAVERNRMDSVDLLRERANQAGIEIYENPESLKKFQFEQIQKTNPHDDSLGNHTWIKKVEDIKTAQEVWRDGESITPDFTKEMVDKALKDKKVTVYSSYPIEDGVFVTPSMMEAKNYAGNGKVYSKTVPLSDVAWIDGVEGQYVKTRGGVGHFIGDDRTQFIRTLNETLDNPDISFVQKNGRRVSSRKYDVNNPKNYDYVVQDEKDNLYTKFMTDEGYLSDRMKETPNSISIRGNNLKATNNGYAVAPQDYRYNITQNIENVKQNAPSLKQLTDGLSDYQTKVFNDVIKEGADKVTNPKGSLRATHRALEVLNKRIDNTINENPLRPRSMQDADVRDLMQVKNRLNQALEFGGIKPYDAGISKAKGLQANYEQGFNFKPSETKFENLGLKTARDKRAFLQGRMAKIQDNVLSDGGTNLATAVKKDENTLRKLMPKDKFDTLMNKANSIEESFKRLKSIEGQADRELVKDIERGGSPMRENIESKGSIIGRGLDILSNAINRSKNRNLANAYLNPDINEIRQMGGIVGTLKGVGSSSLRQALIDAINK